MPKKSSSSGRPASSVTSLRQLSKQHTRASVSRATGIPKSTLWSWEHKYRTPRDESRIERAVKKAERELTVSKKEIKEYAGELKLVKDSRNVTHLAQAAHRSIKTVEKWERDFTRNKGKAVDRKTMDEVVGAFKAADAKAHKVDSGDITRRTPEGKIITIGRWENFEGARPTKEADAYRIFGVNRHGKIMSSSTYAANYDGAVGDFNGAIAGKDYAIDVVATITQLIYYDD